MTVIVKRLMESGYGDLNYNVALMMRQHNGNGKWVSVHGQTRNERKSTRIYGEPLLNKSDLIP